MRRILQNSARITRAEFCA